MYGCNYFSLDAIEYTRHFIEFHHSFETDKVNFILYSQLAEEHLSSDHLLKSLI